MANRFAPTLGALDADLAALPGAISVWCGALDAGRTAYERMADVPHYAASMMKVPLLVAAYRAAEAGLVDLDRPVPVVNDFASASPGARRFTMDHEYDQDDEVWTRLGGSASLRWLARRMIVTSSNLATNIVLAHVGIDAVRDVLRAAGSTGSRVERGITDSAAADAGLDNVVTARDLAVLFDAIARGARPGGARAWVLEPLIAVPGAAIAAPASCRAMIDVLVAQRHRQDLAAGLPPGTRVAHKNGWVTGVRHAAGIVYPDDAPPYLLSVCTTSTLEGTTPPPAATGGSGATARSGTTAVASSSAAADGGDLGGSATAAPSGNVPENSQAAADQGYLAALIARIAAASWADRHIIGTPNIA